MNDFASPAAPTPAYPPPLPRPAPPRTGCLGRVGRAVVILFAIIGLLATLAVLGGVGRHAEGVESGFGEDEFPTLTETWSSGQGDLKVARVPLQGVIFLDEGTNPWSGGGDASADAALRAIRRATMDPDVAGLLLEVDSGGGGITASDILYNALLDFRRADTNRVVVVHMGDMAASGAYYIALAADHIVAQPTTITGSIGVILSSLNVRQLTERLGIKDVSVKSGDNKDLLNPMADMTPEQRAMLQQLVDLLHSRFVMLVAQHREIPEEKVRTLADGRIFLAPQAVELGLVDEMGYAADAEAAVEDLVGDEVRFVRYSRRTSLRDLVGSPAFWGAAFSEAIPRAEGKGRFELR